MGTEFGLYSKQRLSGTSDTKDYPGVYGGWMFGVNPVFGFLSNVVSGDDPSLAIRDVLITDALTVISDLSVGSVPPTVRPKCPLRPMVGIECEFETGGSEYRLDIKDIADL